MLSYLDIIMVRELSSHTYAETFFSVLAFENIYNNVLSCLFGIFRMKNKVDMSITSLSGSNGEHIYTHSTEITVKIFRQCFKGLF